MESTINATPVQTPFGRLVVGLVIGEIGLMIALLTPISLLLTLKLVDLNPVTATAAFGTVTGLGAIFAMFANPIGGAISDRTGINFGRRRTWILIGSILGSLALLGIAFSQQTGMIILFWCLAQIFFNFAFASFTALLPDQVDESRRASISGILGLCIPFAPILGLVLMTLMVNTPMEVRWITLAAIGVVSATVSCMVIQESKVVFERPKKAKVPFSEALARIYPSPRKFPTFTWGWLTRFLISLAYCSGTYNSLMLMKRFNFSEAQTTSTTTLLAIIGMGFLAIASIFGGFLSDKLRKQKPFVAVSAVIVALGLVLNALASSTTLLFVGNALAGLGYGVFLAVDTALIARILPNKLDAAKDFGIMNIANTVTQSIVPFIGPSLVLIGGWPFFYGALAVSGILSALAVMPIPEVAALPAEEMAEQTA